MNQRDGLQGSVYEYGVVIEIHSETDGTNSASLAMVCLGQWTVPPLKNGTDGSTHSVDIYIFSRAFNGGMNSGMSEVKMRERGSGSRREGCEDYLRHPRLTFVAKRKRWFDPSTVLSFHLHVFVNNYARSSGCTTCFKDTPLPLLRHSSSIPPTVSPPPPSSFMSITSPSPTKRSSEHEIMSLNSINASPSNSPPDVSKSTPSRPWASRWRKYFFVTMHHLKRHTGLGAICAVAYFDPCVYLKFNSSVQY